jgi:hypothetical protein
MNENQLYDKIYEQKDQLLHLVTEQWNANSGINTWYFWFNIASILLPLAFLYFKIDKKRIFELSFFGYSVHVLWSNVDSILYKANLLNHPHPPHYLLPIGITVTAVLLPVTFMLLYQYCSNRGKNFYLYAIIGSLIFAYGFGSISLKVDLLRMHKGMNLHYLFLIDVAVAFIAFWATKLFGYLYKKSYS